MNNVLESLKKIGTNRWVQYIIFWGFSFLILARYFSFDGSIESIDLIYTGLFHLSLWLAVTINSFVLIPTILSQGKYMVFTLLLLTVIGVATWFNIFTFNYLSGWLFPDYYFISYYEWTDIILFIVVYVGITSLLQLSRSWFREAEIRQELAEVKQHQAETELRALRAQINPHFLFNSLNHIYSLAVQQSPKTGPAILQLSDLLRYTIRNMNNPKVNLDDELDYVRQYVKLYKTRVQHPNRIHLSIQKTDKEWSIPSLLLIIFVENCFKHGSTQKEDEEIFIDITFNGSTLVLETQNPVEENRELPKESTGMGLDNARRRLNLLYPDKHKLDMQLKNNTFTVTLKLDLE